MTYKNIDAQTAKQWLDNQEAVIWDVREPAEHVSSCIEYAELKPLSSISPEDIPKEIDKKVIVHCRSGKRSQAACEKFITYHPEIKFFNLEGGILAWEREGFKTIKKSKHSVLPLDRQVQLTVGTFVFISVILGYFISSLFLLIPLFFGAGLMFAGLSGTCGLAMLLAKMPWNQVNIIDS
ncbi:TPA: rhodanese-like domain-containing protein [Legionella pneumophila]|nr:rhodanese-like domain-containing protein [Legionella pneumophila]HBD7283596.1 rhodanese-like domain-containing protein [Legionella pneumophila]HBD9439251.1 rhodanese-like domain-containing protein [Legionella pneumophila]HEN8241115.1 rhodanese-like domain-containing protein [Legionella pneumophila]